jgi:hypothetical protein
VRRAKGLKLAPASAVVGLDARPRTRGECVHVVRPCVYFGCRHHLALDVNEHGRISVNGESMLEDPSEDELDAFVDELLDRVATVGSCSLDVADRNPGGLTLEAAGTFLGVTRERVRQIETKAVSRIGHRIRRRLVGSFAAGEVSASSRGRADRRMHATRKVDGR